MPGGSPQRVGIPIADILAGLFGAFGIMTALKAREHTGRGQHVETSLLAAVVGVHVFHGVGWLGAGIEPVLTGNRHPSIAPYGVFGCADADIVIAVGNESLWRRFAPIVGLDPDRSDIATNDDRVARADALQKEIDALLSDRPAAEYSPRWMMQVCPQAEFGPFQRSTTGNRSANDGADPDPSHIGRSRRPCLPAAAVRFRPAAP